MKTSFLLNVMKLKPASLTVALGLQSKKKKRWGVSCSFEDIVLIFITVSNKLRNSIYMSLDSIVSSTLGE